MEDTNIKAIDLKQKNVLQKIITELMFREKNDLLFNLKILYYNNNNLKKQNHLHILFYRKMSVSRALFNEALSMLIDVNPRERTPEIHNVAAPIHFSIFLIYSFLKTANNGLTDAEKNDVRTTIYNYARNGCGWIISSHRDHLSDNDLDNNQLSIDQYINTVFVNDNHFDISETYTGNDGYNIPYASVSLIRELLADGF